jgi:hypothetical protein
MKHGGVKNKLNLVTWESLLTTANNDFISVLILWYSGVGIGSTYAWMLPHTLEKYLKSYLLISGNSAVQDIKKFGEGGHSLEQIWNKYKTISTSTTSKPKLNQAFDEIIKDLSTIKTQLRYTGFVDYSSDSLLYFYIVLCSLLRYLIIGKTKYRSTFYGLNDSHFLLMNYDPMSQGYGKKIVNKMLHLSLEHACSFTNMGSINQMPFSDYSISNTAILQKDTDCPLCNGSPELNYLDIIKFYRDIRPSVID